MARILDKLMPSTAQRTIKLRQSYDWIKLELSELEGVYEAKKQRILDGIITKSNKKLASLAKKCFVSEYASAIMGEQQFGENIRGIDRFAPGIVQLPYRIK